jgi:hypothetical protein
MQKSALWALALVIMAALGGCSTKEINDTTDSITTDIKNFGEKVTEQH